jgi:4-hydroxythreonine-4-phosphate dehydrogenase
MALPLALTLGEPAGIGPDITFAAWRRRTDAGLVPFYILADPVFLRGCAERIAPDVPIAVVEPSAAVSAFAQALPVVDIGVSVTAKPGHPDSSSAPAAIAAIRRAVHDVHTGRAHAVVTNPVAKSSSTGRFRGARPYRVSRQARRREMGIAAHPVMMLWSPELASFRSPFICRCAT